MQDAQDAWCPPTFSPSRLGRMWFALWIIHDDSHNSLRSSWRRIWVWRSWLASIGGVIVAIGAFIRSAPGGVAPGIARLARFGTRRVGVRFRFALAAWTLVWRRGCRATAGTASPRATAAFIRGSSPRAPDIGTHGGRQK